MPVSPDKFLHLRNLKIYCCGMENFDFLSLISFLKSCPALESFFLSVSMVTSQGVEAKMFNYLGKYLPSP